MTSQISSQISSQGSRIRRRPVLPVLLIGQAMASIDGSIVSVAAPSIRAALNATNAEIQLVLSCYLLTTGVLFVTCARIGDVIGHQRAFLTGLGWFTGASLLCGISVSPTMLILARVAQAIGASLLMPQVFSMIHRHWRGTQRRQAIGLYSMVLALGVAVGQISGGLIAGADLFGLSWRPIFLVNVPLGLGLLIFGARSLPKSEVGQPARLDLVGVALLTMAMTAVTLPLIFSHDLGWPVAAWLILGGGIALLKIFIQYERRARHPVIDLAALRPPEVRFGLISCCIVMGCYTVFLLILTIYLQSQLDFSPIQAGLAFVPYAIGFGLLSLTWNSFSRGLQRMLPVIGPVIFAIGVLLTAALFRDDWHAAGTIPLLLLAGAGHAASYSPLIAQITTQVGSQQASSVSALNSTGPVLAEVIGVAGLGSVYFAASDASAGVLQVAAAIAGLLLIAVFCATRTTVILHRSSSGYRKPHG